MGAITHACVGEPHAGCPCSTGARAVKAGEWHEVIGDDEPLRAARPPQRSRPHIAPARPSCDFPESLVSIASAVSMASR